MLNTHLISRLNIHLNIAPYIYFKTQTGYRVSSFLYYITHTYFACPGLLYYVLLGVLIFTLLYMCWCTNFYSSSLLKVWLTETKFFNFLQLNIYSTIQLIILKHIIIQIFNIDLVI